MRIISNGYIYYLANTREGMINSKNSKPRNEKTIILITIIITGILTIIPLNNNNHRSVMQASICNKPIFVVSATAISRIAGSHSRTQQLATFPQQPTQQHSAAHTQQPLQGLHAAQPQRNRRHHSHQ